MPDAGSVLVVEDEIVIALNIEAELEDAGWRVVGPVGNVVRALDLIAKHELAVAVLDVNLGQDRSYPVADALKERGIPFVFLSGGAAQEMPERFRADRILGKPIRFDELLSVLDDCRLQTSPDGAS